MEHGESRGLRATRRTLLSAAAVLTLGGCDGASPEPAPPTPQPPPPGTARFPGDPGERRAYLGTSLTNYRTAESRPLVGGSEMGMTRRYYQPFNLDLMVKMVSHDAAAGILPFVSLKCPAPWGSVARGDEDRWLDRVFEGLATVSSPVFLALHHEPEDEAGDDGMRPADWVAMQSRAMKRARATADLVTVVPVLMRWTFDRRSGRAAERWLVPDTTVQGVDVYNPWSETRNAPWIPFSDLIPHIIETLDGRPLVVPEFGAASDPFDPSRQALWLADAYDTALRTGIVGLAWFESAVKKHLGRYYRLDADGRREFRALLGRPESARISPPA